MNSDHPLIIALVDWHAVEPSVFIINALARRLLYQESRKRQKHLNSSRDQLLTRIKNKTLVCLFLLSLLPAGSLSRGSVIQMRTTSWRNIFTIAFTTNIKLLLSPISLQYQTTFWAKTRLPLFPASSVRRNKD